MFFCYFPAELQRQDRTTAGARVVFYLGVVYTPFMKKNVKKMVSSGGVFLASLLFFQAAVFPQNVISPYSQKQIDESVENYFSSLTESQKLSQLFLINIEGNRKYFPVEKSELIQNLENENEPAYLVPGGCLLFSYNISSSPQQLIEYINSIYEYSVSQGNVPPYIAVDQEGGLVNRLKEVTSCLPSQNRVAQSLSPQKAHELYELQALQMKYLGFNMNLAPVSEAVNSSNQEFLGSRSFGNTSDSAVYSIAAVSAYQKHSIACTVKHFPGNTNTDPHTGLPEITLSEEELRTDCFNPFYYIFLASPECVLMSHARTSSYDSLTPACLSSLWINDLLKKKLNFTGLVISDDIFMAALAENGFPPETAAVKAIEAGVDIIMLSEKRFAHVGKILLEKSMSDENFKDKIEKSVKKVLAYKVKCGILAVTLNEKNCLTLLPAKPCTSYEEYRKYYNYGVEFYNENFK